MTHYLIIDEANETVSVSIENKLFSDLSQYSIEECTKLIIYKIDIKNKKLTRIRIYEELNDDRT